MGGFFSHSLGIHMLNALMDYDEKMLDARVGRLPTEEELEEQAWIQEMEELENARYREYLEQTGVIEETEDEASLRDSPESDGTDENG